MSKVAVIGLSCLFPGATTPDQFMENLIQQKDSTSKHTKKQIGVDPAIFYSPEKGSTDKYYSTRGGYIQDFNFDSSGFHLPAGWLKKLDDVYQWSLYVSKEALRDSGYLENTSALTNCGIILGNLSFPTKKSNHLFLPIYHKTVERYAGELLNLKNFSLSDPIPTSKEDFYNGRISGYPAAVIAQALSLAGVYFSLDAACSSSLYAVKVACDYLNTGKADMMLAGAVSAGDPFFVNQGFSTFTAYSQNGISCPLDKRSEGLVSGEGAGMFVLKRYEDAVKDGDNIYATICSIGLSNDGKGRSVLSPNAKGQILAYERAYQNIDITPNQISYIECHATGTPVGDPVELESIDTFFGNYKAHPLIGTVKSSFGHLLTCAGMASMIKVILSMAKGIIPATINLQDPVSSPNNVISAEQVVNVERPWPTKAKSRYAAVNAFGFGGTNAHLIFEYGKNQKSKITKQRKTSDPIKIVGMDSFFGSYKNLNAFDHAIYTKKQDFIPLPEKRWKGMEKTRSVLQDIGFDGKQVPKGGFIKDFEMDLLRYKIPPNEINSLIPQQLLMLKVADNAIRDANIKEGANVGVIIAMEADQTLHQFRGRISLSWKTGKALEHTDVSLSASQADELQNVLKESIRNPVQVNEFTSFIGNIMAARISALWDFSGPSFTVSSEENSVYKALEIAGMMLQNGEVDAMVVGGVDMAGNIEDVLTRNRLLGPVNSGDLSFGFNKNTDGWMIGEGAGAVVLKTSDTAEKERDRCYAQIDAMSFNKANTSENITENYLKACELAGVQPSDIDYLEISNTCNPVEPEIKGINDAYKKTAELNCALGSVSANIGNTFTASGIASLIKTALCLYRHYIPGVPKWSAPKSAELWNKSPFYVADNSRTWLLENAEKRYAAIHGTGIDGTVSHLILSEDTTPKKRSSTYLEEAPLYFFPIVADDQENLIKNLSILKQQVENSSNLYQLSCSQYNNVQDVLPSRFGLVILGNRKEKILQEINTAISGITSAFKQNTDWLSPNGSYFTPKPLAKKGELSFVYPGAFNSYIGMGRDTFQLFPELIDLLPTYTCREAYLLRDRLINPRSLNALSPRELNIRQDQLEKNVIATFETGVNAAILNTAVMKGVFGIQPHSAFGYSMGEVAMMFSLGVWENTDKMSEALNTGPLFLERLAGPMNAVREAWGLPAVKPDDTEHIWECYTVGTSASEMTNALKTVKNVYLLFINSPNEVIVGGEKEACQSFIESSTFQSVRTPMGDSIHCPIIKTEYGKIAELHTSPVTHIPNIKFYSCANYRETELTSEIIADNMAKMYCKTIDFPKLVDRVYQDGARIFLELGPKSGCSKWIDDILGDKEHLAISIDQKGADDHITIKKALAKLFSHGVQMDLSMIFTGDKAEVVDSKSHNRSITVGGNRMDEVILSDENKTKFALKPSQYKDQQQTHIAPVPDMKMEAANVIPEPNKFQKDKHIKPVTPSVTETDKVAAQTTPDSMKIQSDNQTQSIAPPAESFRYFPVTDASFYPTELHLRMQQEIDTYRTQISQNHSAFLETRHASLEHLKEMIKLKMMLSTGGMALAVKHPVQSPDGVVETAEKPSTRKPFAGDPYFYPNPLKPGKPANVIWNETDLLEFAEGSIAKVFGDEYAIIDSYKYRVRLPMPPYLLVNRVIQLDARRGEFKPSSLTTEYDIPQNAWYSIDGQIPWAIASESGQCDLLLISFLGIDFQSKGERYYRLTDYTMTFMDELPKEGDTLRYNIKIESFLKYGDSLIFDFGYDCYVDNKLVYKMTGGRAGFPNDLELSKGKGVVLSQVEEKARRETVKQSFTPLLQCSQTTFSRNELLNITKGDMTACFGPAYNQGGKNPSLRFAAEEIMMLDRIVSIDKTGGPWGLGEIIAEKDLAPDDWYFPCHFKDDNVLAGTLVTEGCVQLLGFYMLYLGLQVNTQDARFQPIKNHPYSIRARGQIIQTDTQYTYKMEILEIGLNPRPFARANFYIIMNDKIVVDFRDLGIELVEKSPSDPAYGGLTGKAISPAKKPLYDSSFIDEFATGSLEKCFGPEYRVYEGRKGPRTPNGDLQFISRIMDFKGERFNLKKVSEVITEYDVPANMWFFEQNSFPTMPYSIIMEIALQPCAFLSVYMGATLTYPEAELCFRNLGADADLITNVDLRGKTVVAKTRMVSVAKAAETVIVRFEINLSCDGVCFYKGETHFGYYTPKALGMQRGLDRGEKAPPWFEQQNIALTSSVKVDLMSQEARRLYYQSDLQKPHYRLAGDQLEFLNEAYIFENSGLFGKGYIYACKKVDPRDWFYPYHFYKDPVMPGSLGVEAILQAMRLFSLQQNLGSHLNSPYFINVPGKTQWKYAGQITPDNETMDIEIHIKSIHMDQGQVIITADANLWKDKLRIYEITNAAIALVAQ